jgi:hypothetical protein
VVHVTLEKEDSRLFMFISLPNLISNKLPLPLGVGMEFLVMLHLSLFRGVLIPVFPPVLGFKQ